MSDPDQLGRYSVSVFIRGAFWIVADVPFGSLYSSTLARRLWFSFRFSDERLTFLETLGSSSLSFFFLF